METNGEKISALPQPTEYWSIDKILNHVGEYGKFQKLLTVLLFFMCIPISYPIVQMYFSSLEPSWRCTTNSTTCNSTAIFPGTDQSKCSMNRSDWEYTKPKSYSFATQFDVICEKRWIVDVTTSISFLGWGVGAIVLGWVGDKYGRKVLLMPSVGSTLIITLVTPFLPNFYLIILFRFFSCFFISGSTLTSFILISEVAGPSKRAMAGILMYLTVPLGFCFIVAKAYLLEDWRKLGIACSVPYFLVLGFYSFIPESIAWLVSKGRRDEVMKIVDYIAHWNKTELPLNVVVYIPEKENFEESTSFIDIFRTRKLAMTTLICGYLWVVVGMGYFGLYMAANDLGGSVYIDFSIMSLSELASPFFAVYVCQRFGRKRGTLSPTFVGGLLCFAVAAIKSKGAWLYLRIGLGMIGKFMISTGFYSIYLWTIDLYPPKIRAKGMGWAQIMDRIGATLGPWISDWTSPFGGGVPFLTMGVPVIVGCLLSMKLPESQVFDDTSATFDKSVDDNSVVINTNISDKETNTNTV